MFERIKDWLNSCSVRFREVHHEVTRTSEESAKARGEDLAVGGKALVLKVDDRFMLFVISAARKLDSNALKNHFKAKKIRFASSEELLQITGLEPGSVPPFGQPFFDLDLYVDRSVTQNEKIAFNAGSLTDSLIISSRDYISITSSILLDFSK